jgi:hypothetical protein
MAEKFPSLYKSYVYHRIHKNLTLNCFMHKFNIIHTLHSVSSKSIPILPSTQTTDITIRVFFWDFPSKTVYSFLTFTCFLLVLPTTFFNTAQPFYSQQVARKIIKILCKTRASSWWNGQYAPLKRRYIPNETTRRFIPKGSHLLLKSWLGLFGFRWSLVTSSFLETNSCKRIFLIFNVSVVEGRKTSLRLSGLIGIETQM